MICEGEGEGLCFVFCVLCCVFEFVFCVLCLGEGLRLGEGESLCFVFG